jgi:urea transport system ATP-binding protein
VTLLCENVHAGYGAVRILTDVSLTVAPGECLALLGKNGMGKTTFLKAISGVAERFSGRVSACGQDVSDWPTHKIIRLGVSYIPQEEPIFEDLTVEDNLRLGAMGTKNRLGTTDYATARAAVIEMFPRLGDRKNQKAGTLSGGEQKMLIIARAFLSRPRLVLIDEVSEGLAPALHDTLAEVIRTCREEWGTAVLLVEQNIDFALGIAERFAVLSGGRIVEKGSVADRQAVAAIEQHMIL